MTATERRTVALMRFAERHGLTYEQVAKLSRLAHAAHRAGERYCSIDRPGLEEASDRAQARFEKYAAECGFTATWPGLWPVLHRDGRDVYLPE